MGKLHMTADQDAMLRYTVDHFQEIARQNRFAENASIGHDTGRCGVCRPELLPLDPFFIYIEVATQSVKVRRPRLDQALADEINKDLILMESPSRVSLESLRSGDPEAVRIWRSWLRDALSTGLGLLSIHSPTSREFDLEEAETCGFENLIRDKVEELKAYQTENITRP
jgi:hypothetical protein